MPARQAIAKVIDSPLGPLQLVAEDGALTHIAFAGGHDPALAHAAVDEGAGADESAAAVLARAAEQLAEYFAGERRSFDLPLHAGGTAFQRRVWGELAKIPFGETRSYADLARATGNKAAVRAVGAANGRNPLPIVVPCHRVIGSDGSLTGFAGGVERKEQLLRLEGALLL